MAEVTHDSTFEAGNSPLGNLPHKNWREYVTRNRVIMAGGMAFALVAAVGTGVVLGRSSGGEAASPQPGGDKGVAAGAPFPGSSLETSTAPTDNSGGFNNAAKVVLKCTGLQMEEAKDDEARTGAKGLFKVTPVVEVVSGDVTSPYLYTLLGTDTGKNHVQPGVGTFLVDSSDNAEFPVIVLADTAGTQYKPGDPTQLEKPFGDTIPDSQLFDCPVVPYPATAG